jgi:hypothetical protein
MNMIKTCFRCKNEYDMTYYTHKNKVYKVCKLCRNKNEYNVFKKNPKQFEEVEKTLEGLNYQICKYTNKIFEMLITNFNSPLLKSMIENRQVIKMPYGFRTLIPLSNNSIMVVPDNIGDIRFLINNKTNKSCDICFKDKKEFLSCSRCKNSFCSECYKRSNLYCCMFCRYTLEDHLNKLVDGKFLNLLNREDAKLHYYDRIYYVKNQ